MFVKEPYRCERAICLHDKNIRKVRGIAQFNALSGKTAVHLVLGMVNGKLYSMGGTGEAVVQEWDAAEKDFIHNLAALRNAAVHPGTVPGMSLKEKVLFARKFQKFDRSFAQFQSFTRYNENDLEGYGITRQDYEEYAAHYLNVMEELRSSGDDNSSNGDVGDDRPDKNYELVSYIQTKVDYEYAHFVVITRYSSVSLG